LDQVSGIPKILKVSTLEIREALQEPIQAIVAALKEALENTPPELAADIKDRGIVMTGGGAMLRGLPELLREHTDLPINLMDDPLFCVVLGTGKILDDFDKYRPVIMRGTNY
jgi:rod shape-determining protein MreB